MHKGGKSLLKARAFMFIASQKYCLLLQNEIKPSFFQQTQFQEFGHHTFVFRANNKTCLLLVGSFPENDA